LDVGTSNHQSFRSMSVRLLLLVAMQVISLFLFCRNYQQTQENPSVTNNLASFSGPSQLSVTCSVIKLESLLCFITSHVKGREMVE